MASLKRREGFLNVLVIIGIIIVGGVVLYFGFTNNGDAEFRAIKEKIKTWQEKVIANEDLILAAKNMLNDFDSEKSDTMNKYIAEKSSYETTKNEINTLVRQYNTKKAQENVLKTGLEETESIWEQDELKEITIGGNTLSAKQHMANLEKLSNELEHILELHKAKTEKMSFQKENLELMSETIEKIDKDRSDWEIKIEKFKVQLESSQKVLAQYQEQFEKGSKNSYGKLLDDAERIEKAFNDLEIKGQVINEFSQDIPDYVLPEISEQSTDTSDQTLPEALELITD